MTAPLCLTDPRLLAAVYPWEPGVRGGTPQPELIASYRRESGLTDNNALATRAAAAGLDVDSFLARLAPSAVWPEPAWWTWLKSVEPGPDTAVVHRLAPARWQLLGHLHPELKRWQSDLRQALSAPLSAAEAERWTTLLMPAQVDRIFALALPTALLELKLAAGQGQLQGADSAARFAHFCAGLAGPRRAALRDLYPLLWRDLAEQALAACAWWPRLCQLLRRHGALLSARFGFSIAPETVVGIDGGLGDRHHAAAGTVLLYFADGGRLLCKPRSLKLEAAFQQWFGGFARELGWSPPLPVLVDLDGEDLGFAGFVAAVELADDGPSAARWYRHAGVLLAVAHGLLATDLHHENWIATACGPVAIDLETLLQPYRWAQQRRSTDLLGLTVLRTGILPREGGMHPAEFSALLPRQGLPYQAADLVDEGLDSMRLMLSERQRAARDPHLPHFSGRPVLIAGHEQALLAGFADAARLLAARAERDFAGDGALAALAALPQRVVLRATQQYQSLLDARAHSRYLRCAARRLGLIDKLWAAGDDPPLDPQRAQTETIALMSGWVPRFTGRPGQIDPGGSEAPLTTAARRIAELADPVVVARQQHVIRMTLVCAVEGSDGARVRTLPTAAADTRATDWSALATAVAGHLRQLALRDADHLNWPVLEASARGLCMQPAGLGLYNGIAGLWLCWARWCRAAPATAADHAFRDRLRDSISHRVLRNPGALPSAGLAAAGGVLYADGLVGQLGAPVLPEAARQKVLATLDRQLPGCTEADVISGLAGAVLGLSAQLESGATDCGPLRERLVSCCARLQQQVAADGGWRSTHYGHALTGIAHGAAGVALALVAASRWLPESGTAGALALAADALRFEERFLDVGGGCWRDARHDRGSAAAETCMAWCHGLPGLLHARLVLRDALPEARATLARLAPWYAQVAAQGFGSDWVLCHGDLGQWRMLAAAARAGLYPQAAVTRCAVDQAQRWTLGWPALARQAVNPGLFDGLGGLLWAAMDGAGGEVPGLDLLGLAPRWESR